ncbi:polyketide cyclase / dehydrase and lipid transport [Mycobacterium kyorinense]|uniref:Polyketide cyclase / dehydrase and lipid transport n=1 Tax=Mycobacterium kyorinense TaxID=487514 RepID=A0A1A2Z8R1_9MYCO|nr:polyketide cyclase / dehydrase and lipid transport [Mycobacterium kyorinense]OBI45902.1 polyketide cyclase / dehydrase and lipid transport [Mycobacterium kyorinense]
MSWWITQVERTLTEEVAATPEQVRDFYVDLNNIRTVHPLVVAVRTTLHRETNDGYEQIYRITDRIPLGRLNLRVSYWARLQVPRHGDVITQARQFPQVRLDGRVSFESTAIGTRIIERLHIAVPRPLAAITTREAVTAHIAMLAGIRDHFQSIA